MIDARPHQSLEYNLNIRVLAANETSSPTKYSWCRVYRDTTGTWNNLTESGNYTYDAAYEYNNGSLSIGSVYSAGREPRTGQLLVAKGGGGGANTKTQSNPIIMLLGPWADYKDCPGVPAKPPTFTANGTDFCVPPYAWAAYDVCNYKYVKKFDMRDFGHWATELNGGGASAFRRLYNAYYGNSTDTANFTANTPTSCKGVRFLGFSSQGSLTCTCPTWMANVKCLMLKFKTVPRPCPPDPLIPYCGITCWQTIRDMDDNNMWDKEYTVQLCSTVDCFLTGTVGTTPWYADIQWFPAYGADTCFWGPDIFDPCNPCDGFGKFSLTISSGNQVSDCGGAGVATSWMTDLVMKDLVTNCAGPKKPTTVTLCQGCKDPTGNAITLILPESIELSCCSPKNLGTCP